MNLVNRWKVGRTKSGLRKGGICTGLLQGQSGRGQSQQQSSSQGWLKLPGFLVWSSSHVVGASDLCGGPDAEELSCLHQGKVPLIS